MWRPLLDRFVTWRPLLDRYVIWSPYWIDLSYGGSYWIDLSCGGPYWIDLSRGGPLLSEFSIIMVMMMMSLVENHAMTKLKEQMSRPTEHSSQKKVFTK